MTRRAHPPEVKQAAIAMYREGVPPRSIAARLCTVPLETIKHWCQESGVVRPWASARKPKSKSGSGVIAPAPYVRNYRWGSGW